MKKDIKLKKLLIFSNIELLPFLFFGVLIAYLLDFFNQNFLTHLFSFFLFLFFNLFFEAKLNDFLIVSDKTFLITSDCVGLKAIALVLPYLFYRKELKIFFFLSLFFVFSNFFRVLFEISFIILYNVDLDVYLNYVSNIFYPLLFIFLVETLNKKLV